MKNSKTQAILNRLKDGKTITSMEAFEWYGATRLSAIIFELKRQGYAIEKSMCEGVDRYGNTTRYAEYYMVEEEA